MPATLRFWQNQRQFYSRAAARPGGRVDPSAWPKVLGQTVPRGLAVVRVPSR